MREIKFRAYDVEESKMSAPFCVCDKEITYRDNPDIYMAETEDLNCSEFNIMQYTGLKDRNDKEIYEGDIIELRQNDFCDGLCCDNRFRPPRRVVSYSHCSFSVNPHGGDTAVTVIGNIYESPELLKSK